MFNLNKESKQNPITVNVIIENKTFIFELNTEASVSVISRKFW